MECLCRCPNPKTPPKTQNENVLPTPELDCVVSVASIFYLNVSEQPCMGIIGTRFTFAYGVDVGPCGIGIVIGIGFGVMQGKGGGGGLNEPLIPVEVRV